MPFSVPFRTPSSDPERLASEMARNLAEIEAYLNANTTLSDVRLDNLESRMTLAEAEIDGVQDEMLTFTGGTSTLATYDPASPGSLSTWDTALVVTNPDPTANMNVYAMFSGAAVNTTFPVAGIAFDTELQVSVDGGSNWTTVAAVSGNTTFISERCPFSLAGARINMNPSGSIRARVQVQHGGSSGEMSFEDGSLVLICTRT